MPFARRCVVDLYRTRLDLPGGKRTLPWNRLRPQVCSTRMSLHAGALQLAIPAKCTLPGDAYGMAVFTRHPGAQIQHVLENAILPTHDTQ